MFIAEPKLIAVLGPTASGKTELAVKLALRFNGEIISADSRQVYRGMDIGTGKDLQEYRVESQKHAPSSVEGSKVTMIPYHLIDVVGPGTEFNMAKFQKLADRAIEGILKRGKVPIIAGGTGLYLQAVVDNYQLPAGQPDMKLRRELEKLKAEELYGKLENLNRGQAESLNESDRKNKRRLIRKIEICSQKSQAKNPKPKNNLQYNFLVLGLTQPQPLLDKKIYKRLIERLERGGMAEEVKRLHYDDKISWKRLEQFGLEYKFIALYLQHKISYEDLVELLFTAIKQFSRRQMTWFKRWEKQGRKIFWTKNYAQAEKLVKEFLSCGS